MMRRLYTLNPAAHLDIATYGSSVQGASSSYASTSSTPAYNGMSAAFVAGSSVQRASSSYNSTSSTSASNSESMSAALMSIVNGFSAHRELHEFAGARKLANDFVKQAFGLRMEVCEMCSERWRKYIFVVLFYIRGFVTYSLFYYINFIY